MTGRETAHGAELVRRSSEILVVPTSGQDCKGIIMLEFTLYIVIQLTESPKAPCKHGSCSVIRVRIIPGPGPSFPLEYRVLHGCAMNPSFVSVSTACETGWQFQFTNRSKSPVHRQCFWSHRSTWWVFHLCSHLFLWDPWSQPVSLQELVGQVFVTVNVRRVRQQNGDSPAASHDMNALIIILQILATDQKDNFSCTLVLTEQCVLWRAWLLLSIAENRTKTAVWMVFGITGISSSF